MLPLLHTTSAKIVDEMCVGYRDTRRMGEDILRVDPSEVAARAESAIRKLRPCRIALEGLDDEALMVVLQAASDASLSSASSCSSLGFASSDLRRAPAKRGVEVLWLQRGLFSGACLQAGRKEIGLHLDGA